MTFSDNQIHIPTAIETAREVGRYQADFINGRQPDWLHVNASGSGDVTFETNDGGRARVETGTGSNGSGAVLSFGDADSGPTNVVPNQYDVIVLQVWTRAPSNGVWNHTTFSHSDGKDLRSARDGGTYRDGGTNFNLPQKNWNDKPVRQTIVLEVKDRRSYCLTGGMTTSPADPTEAALGDGYQIEFFSLHTNDTSTNHVGHLYSADLRFFRY